MARVLVIEPDVQICKFIAGILSDFGHDVHQCCDPDQGIGHLAASAFDILVSDLLVADGADEVVPGSPPLPRLTLAGESHAIAIASQSLPLRDRPFRFADLAQLVAEVARLALNARAIAA